MDGCGGVDTVVGRGSVLFLWYVVLLVGGCGGVDTVVDRGSVLFL